MTAELSRKVYDDFIKDKSTTDNQKLCDVREAFDKYNLISALHSCYSTRDKIYNNILPPLNLLEQNDYQNLLKNLSSLNFKSNSNGGLKCN